MIVPYIDESINLYVVTGHYDNVNDWVKKAWISVPK